MMPYNFKVWAHPPKMMNKEWIGERVSVVDIARVLGNVVLDRDDAGWGPNSTFKYPRHGGTGGLFDRMRPYVQENLRLCTGVASVDVARKQVVLKDGTRESYDILLNTTPVDLLVKSIDGEVPDEVKCQAGRLRHSGSYIVGVGIEQPVPSKKCWMYFPEENSPFYRVTYLSNYSPEVVPDATRYYSLLAEVSHSEFKPVNRDTVVEDTIQGMINTKLLQRERPEGHRRRLPHRARLHVSDAEPRARLRAARCCIRGSSRRTSTRAGGSARGGTRWGTWTTRWRRGWSG